MKTCPKCSTAKLETEFHKDKNRLDGLYTYCKECKNTAERVRFAAIEDLTAHRARVSDWRRNNLGKAKEMAKRAHAKNRDKRNASSIQYRKDNIEHTRALCRKWAKDNAEKMYLTNADRRAKKKNATPAWANDEFDRFVVSEAYSLAKLRTKVTGVKWHVDHSVPLRNNNVCGFHCAANVRVITAVDNHIKGNRVWPDMWADTPKGTAQASR